jgi:hypothetical protein
VLYGGNDYRRREKDPDHLIPFPGETRAPIARPLALLFAE